MKLLAFKNHTHTHSQTNPIKMMLPLPPSHPFAGLLCQWQPLKPENHPGSYDPFFFSQEKTSTCLLPLPCSSLAAMQEACMPSSVSSHPPCPPFSFHCSLAAVKQQPWTLVPVCVCMSHPCCSLPTLAHCSFPYPFLSSSTWGQWAQPQPLISKVLLLAASTSTKPHLCRFALRPMSEWAGREVTQWWQSFAHGLW